MLFVGPDMLFFTYTQTHHTVFTYTLMCVMFLNWACLIWHFAFRRWNFEYSVCSCSCMCESWGVSQCVTDSSSLSLLHTPLSSSHDPFNFSGKQEHTWIQNVTQGVCVWGCSKVIVGNFPGDELFYADSVFLHVTMWVLELQCKVNKIFIYLSKRLRFDIF